MDAAVESEEMRVSVNPLTSTLSTLVLNRVLRSGTYLRFISRKLAKFSMEGEETDCKGDVLAFRKDSSGEGMMKDLARGSCPKPGQLTLPSPSLYILFADLEKFFSANAVFHFGR